MNTTDNRKFNAMDIILKILAVILLVSAVLKGWELLTLPMAEIDIWSNRPFQIFVVQFEIALGIWLISGMFKKAAWVAALGCFTVFSVMTVYLGLTGAASCGCFGPVKVNPWITLFVIDVPAVIFLLIFRPKLDIFRDGMNIKSLINYFLFPLPSLKKFLAYAIPGVVIIAASTGVLILNEPPEETDDYIVLRPQNWPGQELPILDNIDLGGELQTGNWFALLYDHTCTECPPAIERVEQMAIELQGNEEFLRFAFIEIPHEKQYGPADYVPQAAQDLSLMAQLDNVRDWIVLTPTAVLMSEGQVKDTWPGESPTVDELLEDIYGGNIPGFP